MNVAYPHEIYAEYDHMLPFYGLVKVDDIGTFTLHNTIRY